MPATVAPVESQALDKPIKEQSVKLKKELGLMDGVTIIVGVIVGSGIFISPKGVLLRTGSIGVGLIIWIFSGLLSLVGAMCYAELGTMIPKSGGDYAYIDDAFGPLPAFLYLWAALFILVPTGNAITAITFAEYILQPISQNCSPPYEAVRLIAALVTCLLTVINCYDVKWVTKLQDAFNLAKIAALLIILGAGLYWAFEYGTYNLASPMEGTKTQATDIAVAAYSGLFSYSGWNYLNFVTEELKDPYRNLPKAISISLPLITVIYVLTNLAYFVVLTKGEIIDSNAVAVTFGNKMLGSMSWIMPLAVAVSTFGALNGAIFASSRLFFVGARNGHLPNAIALINISKLTPMPALIFLCIITVVLVLTPDVYALINYVSFVESLFTTVSICGFLWLRYKKPDLHRPIKVSLFWPILFLIICIFLVAVPTYREPVTTGWGVAIILLGIPCYLAFIWPTKKIKALQKISHKFNESCSKLFMCIPEEKDD